MDIYPQYMYMYINIKLILHYMTFACTYNQSISILLCVCVCVCVCLNEGIPELVQVVINPSRIIMSGQYNLFGANPQCL